ncbi:hypothetical protein IGI37_001370 [Enterococcus sp. AZ194]|uniref:SpaA isopeptide-forming pilin-related protein n=1 Tax=Enterococcus sp. AZ194 TaxID=2774629 RepID=UPI003F1E7B1E
MNLLNKTLKKWFCLLSVILIMFGQLGLAQMASAVEKTAGTPKEETVVYHDYQKYQEALKKYNEEEAQYQNDLDEYNQKKQEHDDAQAEADRVTQENAEKKAAYEKALAKYQKELDEYNKKKAEVDDHASKGQYIGPDMWGVYAHMENYLVDYAAMKQMSGSGLSISGEALKTQIQANMATDPFGGTTETKANIEKVISEWDKYRTFLASIYSGQGSINMDTLTGNAIGGAWYNGFMGAEFYHTFSSSTGQTDDNIPNSLDHPTEEGIKSSLSNLFVQTNGGAFDSAGQNMDDGIFLVNQAMVASWTNALNEAKTQAFALFDQAIQEYISAFEVYNQSNYESADFAQFTQSIEEAGKTELHAENLIGGLPNVQMFDKDNTAPFYNDLKNLSPSELANKYGYLKLLTNMANSTTFGYFHTLKAQPGETISVATASSWGVGFHPWGKIGGDFTPRLTEPTPPTPPMYEIVPNVPEEPVPPVPPVKPVYEPLNEISLLKLDKETREPLANATFELSNNDTGEKLGSYQSEADGFVKISNVQPGNYSLVETAAPDGYIVDNTPLTFIVKGTENESIQIEKTNVPITGSVELSKLDEKTKDALQGAVFEIRDSEGTVIRSALQSNAEGKILVDGLRVGDYEFVETKAPTGYELDNTPVPFAIKKTQNEVVKVSMENHLATGGAILTKKDATTGDLLQGAVFELQDGQGTTVQSGLITDATGRIFVDGLAPGNYQFVETKAPTGYDLDATPVTVTIVKGQTEAAQISKTNQLISGGVILTKTDAATGEALQGAVFELQTRDGKAIQNGLTTDETGKIAADGLAPGDYQLIETQAPTGYQLDVTPVLFTIKKGQTEAVQVTMKNRLAPGGVVLTKLDSKSGEVLQGAIFELQDKDGKLLQSGLSTDETGKLTVNDLVPGDYQFVETKAPTGYKLDQTPVEFTIEKDQRTAIQVAMTNELETGGVVLTKLDAKSGEALQGAVFELKDNTGKGLENGITTDVSGKLAINGLEPGDYQLIETQAPTGYKLDQTPVKFTIEKGQKEAVQVSMVNQLAPGEVVLIKRDAKSGEVLQGAIFELQDKDGQSIKNHLTTDISGKISVNGLEPGSYQFVETNAPTGYQLDATPIIFEITKDQKTAVQVNASNELMPGSVVLTKIDAQSGDALQGATFDLKDKDGKSIKENLITNLAGKIAIDGLIPGTYQFVETKAPTGYKLDESPVTFCIERGQTATVQVTKTNQLMPGGVILEKIDDKTGKKLAGAEFTLQTAAGKIIQEELVTDSSGRLAIEGLTPGDYQLIETKAPDGYQLDKAPVTFTIEKGQKNTKKVKKPNKSANWTVRLEKKDGQTKAFLQGAEFKLLDSKGKEIKRNVKTDMNGTLEITDLKPGSYQLIETRAPKGYELDNQPVLFSLDNQKTFISLDIYNYQKDKPTDDNESNVSNKNNSNRPSHGHDGYTPSSDLKPRNSTYLPKTGENTRMSLSLSVTGLLVVVGLIFVIRKKIKE